MVGNNGVGFVHEPKSYDPRRCHVSSQWTPFDGGSTSVPNGEKHLNTFVKPFNMFDIKLMRYIKCWTLLNVQNLTSFEIKNLALSGFALI